MRILIINLLATALLLFGATSASAFAFYATLNPGSADINNVLTASDSVIIDIYADADPGVGFMTVAVTFDDDGILNYVPGSSSQPTYILYTAGSGSGMTAVPATYLIPATPFDTDPPALWPAPPPDKLQVNSAWQEVALGSATASGTGIWLGTLLFHVSGIGDGQSTVNLTLDAGGTTVILYTVAQDENLISTTGTFVINTIPEPTTALLIGFGLVGLTLAGRRKS